MPNSIKTIISIIVLCVGGAGHLYEKQSGNADLSWVVAGLAAFMVIALWLFPETGSRKGNQ